MSTELFFVVARNRHVFQAFLRTFDMSPNDARHVHKPCQLHGHAGARVFYVNDYRTMENIAEVQHVAARLGMRKIEVIL